MNEIRCLLFFTLLLGSSFTTAANRNLAIVSDTCFILEISRTPQNFADDAEEWPNGIVNLSSSDLELINDIDIGNQTVGIRFSDITIASGTEILEAYIQFTSDDESSTGFTNIQITTESTDNAAPFVSSSFNLSNRTTSDFWVSWLPDDWLFTGVADEQQRTPELKELVQSVVDRSGWQIGNAISFIFSGSGRRIAAAADANPNNAPRLIIKIAYPKPTSILEGVFINELMSSNNSIPDEHGETDDWIEIYNNSNQPVFLGDLYLTDDPNNLQKWELNANTLLAPNDFMLIWADETPEQGSLHTNFRLNSGGEFLALTQDLNGTLHVLDSLDFPPVSRNTTYGRVLDGATDFVNFGNSSPAASNNGQPQILDASIDFSIPGGHYPTTVSLSMSVSDPTASIYYTTDGSFPTEQSPSYQGPITIDQTQQINARAIKSGFISNQISSEFFLINESAEIGVINVQSDPANFWDNEKGIYVSGTNGTIDYCNNFSRNWNQDWERPCHLTFWDADDAPAFSVNAGMKIGGACSRNLKMKSFNFFLRNGAYGDEKIDYQIFPQQENINEYRRIKIRNSGSDWVEMAFRDGMNYSILQNTVDLDLMAYRPVRVYLNGAYWGMYGLREMFNKHYIESHHGVNSDNVDILGDPYGPRSQIRDGDLERYDEMVSFLNNNNLSESNNYQIIQDFIDLDQYLNYHIAQIYLANYDWPGNNVRVWRDKDGGKFRWMLFDTDASAGWRNWSTSVANPNHNTLSHMLNTQPVNMNVPGFTEWPNGAESTFLFRKLMENSDFKNEFAQRTCTFRELIFAPERVHPLVDEMEALLLPEMDRHISNWLGNNQFGSGIPSGGSVAEWQSYISNYKSFFANRDFFILSIFQNTLNLEGRFNLTFGYDQTTNGDVFVHQNEMAIPFDYQGEYFENMPIKIKAVPHENYFFSHWLETGETNSEIEFITSENATITPVFTTENPVNANELTSEWSLTIYPNPVKDILRISYLSNSSQFANMTITNVFGQQVLNMPVTTNNNGREHIELSVKSFTPGIYWVRIEEDLGRSISKVKRVIIP